jgi:hypothetical protein
MNSPPAEIPDVPPVTVSPVSRTSPTPVRDA